MSPGRFITALPPSMIKDKRASPPSRTWFIWLKFGSLAARLIAWFASALSRCDEGVKG